MNNDRHPIKRVKFVDADYKKVDPPKGGGAKSFKTVTQAFRQELVLSIKHIAEELGEANDIQGVAVVTVEERAEAKSHRPTGIFNDNTCPFFGDIGFGKFLIQVSPDRLRALSARVSKASGKAPEAQLSTIKSIEPYHTEVLVGDGSDTIYVRLFRFNDSVENQRIDAQFESFLDRLQAKWEKSPFESIRVYKLFDVTPHLIEQIVQFSTISRITSANSIEISHQVLSDVAPNPIKVDEPDAEVDYPVVGVVDSGINIDCPHVSPWVYGVHQYVAIDRSLYHGSFVAGLVSNARPLNGGDGRFTSSQSKVLSVEVLDKNGGDVINVMSALSEVAQQHPEIKVWNLSMGSTVPASPRFISEFAILLDEFQSTYNCLCVVSAGNYVDQPFRSWPPIGGLNDGISSPGDSVKALTVGSLAHVDGFVKNNEPSHFSRRGPVSNFIQKPEVVHYGGNAVINPVTGAVKRLGVNSISDHCSLADDIGTSFSAPMVSTLAANLFHKIGASSSPQLVKALLVHSANLNSNIKGDDKHFYGWGIPAELDDILTVSDHEITIVMEGMAKKSYEVEKLPFPIPECLRTEDGKVRGEFFITLVYDTPFEPEKAYEYCQINMNVGLGEYADDGSFSSSVPREYDYEFEKKRVTEGDKWSPVKVYQKRFPQGTNVENWRLRLDILNREGFEPSEMVPFVVIITLRDIDGEAPVYNEMSRLMDEWAWDVDNLVIEPKIQV